MKIEARKDDTGCCVDFFVDGESQGFMEYGDEAAIDSFVRLINAGQALIEQEKIVAKEWWPKKDAVCNMCGGKGVVSVPCPDAKPGSSITCGVLHYGPCPACTPAAERAERYGKLRDKLDEWADADKWEQRRWDACQEFAVHNAENYDPEDTVGYVDALIAEFRKGEAKA